MTTQLSLLLNSMLGKLGLRLVREKKFRRLHTQHAAYTELLGLPPLPPGNTSEEPVEAIVFSRDRALQLHALLTSYYDQVRPAPPLHILYKPTSDQHQQSYRQLQTLDFPGTISWHEETDFHVDFLSMLGAIKSDRIFFLVDDIVFIRPVNLSELMQFDCRHYIPSLRLGKNISRNYTHQSHMALPPFIAPKDHDYCFWIWSGGILDWRYPLSVDGHLFATDEIRVLCKYIQFKAPNSLEKALQIFRPAYLSRTGVCYQQSRIVNLPINKVQVENDNISGEISPDNLLEKWESGLCLDTKALYETSNSSVHEELPVSFIQR